LNLAQDVPTERPYEGAEDSYGYTFHHKDFHEACLFCTNSFQDSNILFFLHDSHDERADNVETRHENNQGKDNKHGNLLKLKG